MDLVIREVFSVSRSHFLVVLWSPSRSCTPRRRSLSNWKTGLCAAYLRRSFALRPGAEPVKAELCRLLPGNSAAVSEHRCHLPAPLGRWGCDAQIAILEKWAVNMNAFYQKAEYEYAETDVAGVDNPNTPLDDRTVTSIEGWTRVRYLDIPVLARIYSKDRHRRGNGCSSRRVRILAPCARS